MAIITSAGPHEPDTLADAADWQTLGAAASSMWERAEARTLGAAELSQAGPDAAAAIGRLAGSGAEPSLDVRSLLLLAMLFHRLGAIVPASPAWVELCGRTEAYLAAHARHMDDRRRFTWSMSWLALLAMTHGQVQGVRRWLRREILDHPPAPAGALEQMAEALRRLGWTEDLARRAVIEHLLADVPLVASGEEETMRRCFAALTLLGFGEGTSDAGMSALYQGIGLPAMTQALAQNQFNAALLMEKLIYQKWVGRVETEAHYDAVMSRWEAAMSDAGRRLAAMAGPRVAQGPSETLITGFFIHQASMLAHIRALHILLDGALQDPQVAARFRPVLYVWNGYDAAMDAMFSSIGVAIRWLHRDGRSALPPAQRLMALCSTMALEGVTAVVWLCAPVMLSFAFGLRLAPVQIWLSLKFHPRVGLCADELLSGALVYDDEVAYFGRRWKAVRGAYADMLDMDRAAEAASLRAQLSWKFDVVTGVMAREQKIADPGYLQAVATILRNNPRCCFCYTGRRSLPEIADVFAREGVADQAIFIGWVDPLAWAHVFDIYLDAWPMSSGFTAVNCMAAGKAYVFRDGMDAAGGFSLVEQCVTRPLARGGPAGAVATLRDIFRPGSRDDTLIYGTDISGYCAAAQRLIDDGDLRRRCGESYRQLVERMLCDKKKAGAGLVGRIFDAVNKKVSPDQGRTVRHKE